MFYKFQRHTLLKNKFSALKKKMIEVANPSLASDKQTQFGNSRQLDPSDCIFVFKDTQSDYEEPHSDQEVNFLFKA